MTDQNLILRGRAWVAPLCWIAVLLDGFDAVVLGAVLPSMLADKGLGLTAVSATFITTIGLVGMMLGSLSMGWATDRFGRRRLMIGSVIAFSAFTFAAGFTDSVAVFAALRFLAGLGLGGCLPTGIAMVTEFAGRRRHGNAATTMMTGYHVGAVLTAALALVVLVRASWHTMFIIGALPALVLVPLMVRYLPESPDYLMTHGRLEEARRVAAHYDIDLSHLEHVYGDASPEGPKEVFSGPATMLQSAYRRNTLSLWVASFMGLLLVYGLNTWLPQIMRAAKYDLGNAIGFLLVLNAGAILGLAAAGRVADRITPRVAGMIWFISAACMLAALAVKLPLLGIYTLIFITGFFVFSSQVLVNVFVASNYPAEVRGTAIGMTQGVGRLGAITGPSLSGTLVALGIAYPWGFFAFALAAVLGGTALSVTRTRSDQELTRSPDQATAAR